MAGSLPDEGMIIRLLRLPMRHLLRSLNEEQAREGEIGEFKRQFLPIQLTRRVVAVMRGIVAILAVIGGLVVLEALLDALG